MPVLDGLPGGETWDELSLLSAAPGPRDPRHDGGAQVGVAGNSLRIEARAEVGVSEFFLDLLQRRAPRRRSLLTTIRRCRRRIGQVGSLG